MPPAFRSIDFAMLGDAAGHALMSDDRDLGRQLPQSPPPRPDRREAAIDTAVARFKGEAKPAPPIPPRRRPARYRPQVAAIAATALVVVIGLPVWQSGKVETPPPRQSAPTTTDLAVEPAPRTDVSRPVPAPVAKPASPVTGPDAATEAPDTSEAPAPPVPAVKGARTAAAPPVVLQSVTTPPPVYAPAPVPPPPPPPPPPAAAAPQQFAASPAEDIVVSGARMAHRGEPARNDWSRCTVDDPRRALNECRARFGLATPGVKGRAEALTGDAVLRAWQGDRAEAQSTLDRAIALDATVDALVNRALLRMEAGDDSGALADLDRAVRRSPRDARGYHYRGIVQSRLGNTDRAAADARRAAALAKGER
ncbi:hypothetical protein [uncultured Sphingomonas sp.]|uniref:hypothetical protein n=1 Tax=uncultured Sphingomonas sp. TaxID=158754 RepID=UPI0025DA2A99|nr:hypothetical protein [uncultured Sphingomonas sp.]